VKDAEERAAHLEGRAEGLEHQLLALQSEVIDDRDALMAAQCDMAHMGDCQQALTYVCSLLPLNYS
jgi:hypothetical protein